MALQKSFTHEATGTVYPEAYHRVMGIHIISSLAYQFNIIVDVSVFADVTRRLEAKQAVHNQSYQIPDATVAAVLAQGGGLPANPTEFAGVIYTMLKTHDDYADALDV